MSRTQQRILLIVIALLSGISIPYLLDYAGRALDLQPPAPKMGNLDEMSAPQRLQLACVAVQQLNTKLNRLDTNRPSFLSDLTQFQKVRPELQQVHRLVCGR